VIDGDTIRMENGQRVRLVQIDAPELGSECYGQKSAAALRSLLPAGTKVRLVRDRRLDNRDRYGRLLRYVFRGSRNVNVVLVRRGAASVWFFEGDRGRFAGRLVDAAEQARNLGRGAWGACDASYDFESSWTVRRKPPPPPPVTAAPPPSNCHPSYVGACLDPYASDYDCEGGSGNGPLYTGPVRVVGDDPFGLDADDDGYGCED
jgi:endonuclease YncB( thermonuclease family)